jgi:hypothetical protein
VIHQDAAHDLAGKREKVPPITPINVCLHQLEVGFMYQRGSRQRVPAVFAGQMMLRQGLKLLIDQGH